MRQWAFVLAALLVCGCSGTGAFSDADLRITSDAPAAILDDDGATILAYRFHLDAVSNVVAKLEYRAEGSGGVLLEQDAGRDLAYEEFKGATQATLDPWVSLQRLEAGDYQLAVMSNRQVNFTLGLYWP